MAKSKTKTPVYRGVVVGAGFFSHFQLEAWSRIPQVRITALADLDLTKANKRAAGWKVPAVYTDVATMLREEQPDFVDIITQPKSHFPLMRLAVDRKIPVLCQKPLATTYNEARRMVAYCNRHRVRMMVNENWRWQVWYREIKALQDKGTLGQPVNLHCYLRRFDGYGPKPYPLQPYFSRQKRFLLNEAVVHFLDTFRLFGGDIRSVFCINRKLNPRIRAEDTVNILCRFKDGALGNIDANRTLPITEDYKTFAVFTFEGDRAVAELFPDGRIRLTDVKRRQWWHKYKVPKAEYFGDCCYHTQKHFIDCLASGKPFESDGRAYLQTLAAVEAGYASARSGKTEYLSRFLRA